MLACSRRRVSATGGTGLSALPFLTALTPRPSSGSAPRRKHGFQREATAEKRPMRRARALAGTARLRRPGIHRALVGGKSAKSKPKGQVRGPELFASGRSFGGEPAPGLALQRLRRPTRCRRCSSCSGNRLVASCVSASAGTCRRQRPIGGTITNRGFVAPTINGRSPSTAASKSFSAAPIALGRAAWPSATGR